MTDKEMLKFQEDLAAEHHYAPVPPNLFDGDVREKYRENLPEWCNVNGDHDACLYSKSGTLIAQGYERIVIGDYGAFIEFSNKQVVGNNLKLAPGQEFRLNNDTSRFKNVKYIWYVPLDSNDCKIYLQKNTVSYADYVPGMYYVSPHEISKK